MADRSVDFLIIGGGVAGGYCARALREEGAEGSILLVGREPDPPYFRPALSKEYLAGKQGREDGLVVSDDWWKENDVELLTGTSVMKVDAGERVAKLSTREEVGFGKALLATGSNVRRLQVEGCELEGIHYLRSYGNSDAIRAESEDADGVVLIGGSFIACEVAATLTARGQRCALVMQEEVTFERQFGRDVGGFFQGVLEEHGIEIHGGDDLDHYEGSDGHVGRVAKSAGLDIGERGGVRCSARLETEVPGLYVAGDIAEYDSPLLDGPARIEHWDVAFNQAKTAARNMAGQDVPHEEIPYFWSDLSDWAGLEYVGAGAGGDDRVVRGSIDDGSFTSFTLADGRVMSAVTVGRSDDLEHARRMIRERSKPDAAALADESTNLGEL